MPSITEQKESQVHDTPVLLFECRFADGHTEAFSTHRLTIEGVTYRAAVLSHNAFDFRTLSGDAIDASSRLSLTLANADSYYSQLESTQGFKGAKLVVKFLFYDLKTNAPASEIIALFRGAANAPEAITESHFRLSFNNRLSLQRTLLPNIRIQKRCPWTFPSTHDQRLEAINGGPKGQFSSFFHCGYSSGETNGLGNPNGPAPFTSCDYTRNACEHRGMFSTDAANNITRRFGGIEFVPSTILVRGYGEKQYSQSAVLENEAKFNDFVPLVYGTAWYQPPVTLARNDGNLTRMEVLLGVGEIEGLLKVIVNGIEIPAGRQGQNMTATGWFNVVSTGNRTGNFNLDFSDGAGHPLGDPYGSLAYMSVVVPNRISNGQTLPVVKVLLQGMKLERFAEDGAFIAADFNNNPAWVLLDLLRRSGWGLEELDMASFARTAAWCGQSIESKDLNGNTVTIAARQCNMVVRKRRSAAELIRGVRTAAAVFLTFAPDGRLRLVPETTLAEQQPSKPVGSNAVQALHGGWPAYEFGDGSNGFSGILSRENGEAVIRLFSRGSSDAPNRFSVEFQDAFNEYQQDSFSLIDIEDARLTGQETSASLPALGLPNFDQTARITRLQLRKSIRGNRYVEFDTSVKAFYMRPGDLITLTYQREGLDRGLFRIIKVSPGINYSSVTITAQLHDDAWYLEAAGDGSLASGRQPGYEVGLPRPLVGSVLHTDGSSDFGVGEKVAGDGQSVQLTVSFTEPGKTANSAAGIPILSLVPQVDSVGGSLEGNQILYYALTSFDAAGSESPLSFVVRAEIPTGANTRKVTLQQISLSSKTVSFNVYRGTSPQSLLRVAGAVAPAATFVDTGISSQLISPPDVNYNSANFYYRAELETEHSANIFSTNTIGNDTLFWQPHTFEGKLVRITNGKGAGQERLILTTTGTTITTATAWSITPDATSSFAILQPTWILAASTPTSPAVFDVAGLAETTIHISGRAANANGKESAYELSPITRWRVGSSNGGATDSDVPPEPVFGLLTTGGGRVYLSTIGFPTLANTRTIASGTLSVFYLDELSGPSGLSVGAALSETGTTLTVSPATNLAVGFKVQILAEILTVVSAIPGGTQYVVSRGDFETEIGAHGVGAVIYPLRQKVYVIPFARNFFGSAGSSFYAYSLDLPNCRIGAASLFLTNRIGDSPTGKQRYTGTTDYGMRTLSGGQITLQVDGFLSIENDAVPPIRIDSATAIRDIYAMVNDAPTGAPIVLTVRQDTVSLAQLTIPTGAKISNVVDGFGLPALDPAKRLSLDIVSVGSAENTTPGADLTVTVRL